MSYRLVYEPGARALVRRLPPDLKPAITQAIESLRSNPYAGKPLSFALSPALPWIARQTLDEE
jgi:hypothetical protein